MTTTTPQPIIFRDLPREAAPITREQAESSLLYARKFGAESVTIQVEGNEFTLNPQLALDFFNQLRTDIVPEVTMVNF